MYAQAALRYQQVQTSTSTPGEILLALYEGLFRFLKGSKLCFENKQLVRGRELLLKSHAIISELLLALDHPKAPELCAQLEAIYEYCLSQILQANLKTDANVIGDILRVLTPLRDAWVEAVPEALRQSNQSGALKNAG